MDAVSPALATAPIVAVVDAYVLRGAGEALEVLRLRRAPGTRCTGAWETVHGRIESGETPTQAVLRELREETGFVPERLYSVSRVERFWLHRVGAMAVAPVFAAFVPADAEPVLSVEHDAYDWCRIRDGVRFAWPRENRALADAVHLLGEGHAGPLEDVLRVC